MGRHIRGLCAFVMISAVLAALVSGCGLSTGANRTNASDGGAIPTPASTLIGTIQVPKASAAFTEGIAVKLRQADGTLVASTVTNVSGCFSLPGGVDGRVEAPLPGGGILAAEVRQASPGYVHVNIPTAINSSYVRTNPGVPLADVEAKVKTSLNIPTRINLRGGLGDTWRSFFSSTAFASTDSSGSFFGNVCTGILKDGLSAGESAATGWARQKLGIDQSATSQQQEYDTIMTELTNLGKQVSALSVQISLTAGYSACNRSANRIQTCWQSFNQYIAANVNSPQQAAQTLISYVGTNPFGTDMQTLTDNLQGNTSKLLTPMVCDYAAQVDSASF